MGLVGWAGFCWLVLVMFLFAFPVPSLFSEETARFSSGG